MTDTILITGASGGVGSALGARLESAGWKVFRVGRDATRLPDGSGVLVADVSTSEGAKAAVEAATAFLGAPPTALAHCAGSTLIAPIARTPEAQYRAVMAANLDSAFFTAQAWVAAALAAKQPGRALFFSSVVAGIGVANHAAIAAAKAGVESLVRSLAADHSAAGLRFNAIAPGLVETPMTARMVSSDAARKGVAAQYPLGRFGTLEDPVAAAAWLLSEASAWITGQVLHLDGGFSAVRPMVRPAG
jgi:NAD(P)-dependent dehydrogenase (short-subunit alcohol dehydrogenase family)